MSTVTSGVALRCPVCGAPAELRSVLTDRGFAVARVTLVAHICDAHGVEFDDAADQVDQLRWEATSQDDA